MVSLDSIQQCQFSLSNISFIVNIEGQKVGHNYSSNLTLEYYNSHLAHIGSPLAQDLSPLATVEKASLTSRTVCDAIDPVPKAHYNSVTKSLSKIQRPTAIHDMNTSFTQMAKRDLRLVKIG